MNGALRPCIHRRLDNRLLSATVASSSPRRLQFKMFSLFKLVLCGLLSVCSTIALTQTALSSSVGLASPDYTPNTYTTNKIAIEAVTSIDTPTQALDRAKLTSRNGSPTTAPVVAPKPAVDPDGRGKSWIGFARVETTERNRSSSPTSLPASHLIGFPHASESDVWSRRSLHRRLSPLQSPFLLGFSLLTQRPLSSQLISMSKTPGSQRFSRARRGPASPFQSHSWHFSRFLASTLSDVPEASKRTAPSSRLRYRRSRS